MIKTQKEAIAEHLRKHGSITSMQAIDLYGVTRLSHWVYILRHEGWNISTERCKGKNRYGHMSSWAKYELEEN